MPAIGGSAGLDLDLDSAGVPSLGVIGRVKKEGGAEGVRAGSEGVVVGTDRERRMCRGAPRTDGRLWIGLTGGRCAGARDGVRRYSQLKHG